MFDVSLGELAVIGAVALVVIGPERLPTVARTIGALIGRAQRFASSIKADLQREVHASELAQIEAELRAEGDALKQTIQMPVAELHETLADARTALSDPSPTAAPPAVEPPRDERQPDLFVAEPEPPRPARDRR